MEQLLLMVHIVVAFCLIGIVLLQQGKGASMGASFGSGASATIFGSRGSLSFMMKVTIFLVAVFFATSISLSYLAAHQLRGKSDSIFGSSIDQSTHVTKPGKR